jgi:hypothetical protein
MNVCVRSSVTMSLGVIGVSALVLTAGVSPEPAGRSELAVVALTAQTQPLAAPSTPAAPPMLAASQPLDLLGPQVTFHVNLAVDFIVTGAQLSGRIVAVPDTVLQDIRSGTPVPIAVSRALVEFAAIEFDAGRELVGFAEEWADFQIGFVTNVISALPPIVSAGPVGQLVTATVALVSQLADSVGEFARGLVAVAETVVHNVLGPGQTQAVPASAPPVTSTRTPTAVDTTARSTDSATVEASDEGPDGKDDFMKVVSTAPHDKAPASVTPGAVKARDEAKSGVGTDTNDTESANVTEREKPEQAKQSVDDEQHREADTEQADSGGTGDAPKSDSSDAQG